MRYMRNKPLIYPINNVKVYFKNADKLFVNIVSMEKIMPTNTKRLINRAYKRIVKQILKDHLTADWVSQIAAANPNMTKEELIQSVHASIASDIRMRSK